MNGNISMLRSPKEDSMMLHKLKVGVFVTVLVALVSVFVGCSSPNSGYEASASSAPNASSVAADSSMSHMQSAPKRLETSNVSVPNANEVVIENFSFAPAVLTVKAGTKVTWVNHDDEPHTATDDDKRFNSKTLDTNDQFSFTFTDAGTYNYFCALHPKMRGQIVVK
jgi:plastocyanin